MRNYREIQRRKAYKLKEEKEIDEEFISFAKLKAIIFSAAEQELWEKMRLTRTLASEIEYTEFDEEILPVDICSRLGITLDQYAEIMYNRFGNNCKFVINKKMYEYYSEKLKQKTH